MKIEDEAWACILARVAELEKQVQRLDSRTASMVRLGPQDDWKPDTAMIDRVMERFKKES